MAQAKNVRLSVNGLDLGVDVIGFQPVMAAEAALSLDYPPDPLMGPVHFDLAGVQALDTMRAMGLISDPQVVWRAIQDVGDPTYEQMLGRAQRLAEFTETLFEEVDWVKEGF